MADNLTLNAGVGGATLSTDDIAGIHVQRVKVQYGVDGSATDISDSNPMPIDDAGGSLTIDNAALSVTGGGVEASALRVTIATDSTGVLSIDDNGGSITVDGTVTANATLAAETTKVIGTVNIAAAQTIATTNAGTFAVQVDGAALTALQLIDNIVSGSGVNVSQINGVAPTMGNGVSGTGVQRVTIASDSTGVVGLAAGTNGIGKLTANSGVDIGDVDVTSISPGSNLIGDVGISGARTSGGTSIFRSIDLDEGALEVVKASAGQIYWIHAMNLASSTRFIKIYNATSGTVGTGTPVLTFPIATQGSANGAGFMLQVPNGIAFSTGICVGASTGVADADTGAPGANEVIVNIGYG